MMGSGELEPSRARTLASPRTARVLGAATLLGALLAPFALAAPGRDGEELRSEYDVKAALLVTFLKFVEREGAKPSTGTLVIGILGEDPFGESFEPVRGKPVMGRKLEVRPVSLEDAESLGACDLVFVSASEKDDLPRILAALESGSALTVGEVPGFLELGGVANLLLSRAGKSFEVGYEINQQAAHDRGLRIDTNILQRAARVIKKGQ